MKKVMLGLVMVMMLMSMVGCGTTTDEEKNSIVESEVETEVKVDINGNVITDVNTNTEIDSEIQIVYGVIESVNEPFFNGYNTIPGTVKFGFYDENGKEKYSMPNPYPYEERFLGQEGKIVKASLKTNGPIILEILSVEIVE